MPREPSTEAWLDERGVTWRFASDIAVARIDKARSVANQARLEPIDPEVVDRYAADMARGDVFPPLLAQPIGKTHKLALLGGNHRYHAHLRVEHDTVEAYVVSELDQATALRLTYEDNRRHGLPPSEAERAQQAMHLVATQGLTQAEAGAIVGINQATLSQRLTVAATDNRADELGVPRRFHQLPHTTRYTLASIEHDDVFAEASKLVLAAKYTGHETKRLVADITAAGPTTDQMKVIGTAAEEAGDRKHRGSGAHRIGAPAHVRLSDALRDVRRLVPVDVADSIPSIDVKLTRRQEILDTAQHLQKIIKAMA